MSDFYYLHVSPWSEKACWAMDLAKFDYQKLNFTPMITTPLVRFKSLNFTKKVTVPTLISDHKTLTGSYDIAQYVEKKQTNKSHTPYIFPPELKTQIDDWEKQSDQFLQAGRALVCIRMKSHNGAKIMSLPPEIPSSIRPLMLPVASLGLYYLKAKYGFDWNKYEQYVENMRKILQKVRSTLADKGDYLLGQFTYADIAMAVTLQMVKPIGSPYIPLDKDTESCWETPELKDEFKDLLEWRDLIYAKHRKSN